MYNDFNNIYQNPYNQRPMQSNYQPLQSTYTPQSMQPIRQQNNLDWIMVQSINQVEQIAVQPGQKAWIMVQNEPIFALRTANDMGLVNTEYYKFEKYNKEAPVVAHENYVTRDEMLKIIDEKIKELKDESIMAAD